MDLKLNLIVDFYHLVADFYQFIHFLPLQLVFTTFFVQNNVFFLIWASENGAIWADPISLNFFLDVVFQLLRHITGLFATRYQMSVCDDGTGGA